MLQVRDWDGIYNKIMGKKIILNFVVWQHAKIVNHNWDMVLARIVLKS